MHPMPASDVDLLSDWRDRRDETAIQALCERYAPLVHAACRRQGSPDPDAAAQAVFILLADKPRAVGDPTRLPGWLLGCTRRVVARQIRGQQRRRRHEQEAAMQPSGPLPDEPAWAEAMPLLDEALGRLSIARREAIVRFYLQRQAQSEIARDLGCSVDAVKTRIHEGLHALRTFFTRRGVSLSVAAIACGLTAEATASESAVAASCAQAVLHPSTAPTAVHLAHATNTAMFIKTILIVSLTLLTVAGGIGGAVLITAEPPATVSLPSAPATNPDPKANAALDWWRAFALMAEKSKEYQPILRLAQDPRVPSTQADAWFTQTQQTPLSLFALGAGNPYCDWGIDPQEGAGALLTYTAPFRDLLRLTCLRARWYAARGNGALAVDDLAVGLRAAQLYDSRQPLIIDAVVSFACQTWAVSTAAAIAPTLDAAARQRLSAELDRIPRTKPLTEVLEQEVRFAQAQLQHVRSLPLPERIRMLKSYTGQQEVSHLTSDAVLDGCMAAYPTEFERVAAHLRLPLRERLEPCSPRFSTGDAHPNALLMACFPDLSALARSSVRCEVQRVALKAGLAFLETGPPGLASVVNPLTGNPFTRESTADGFRLRLELQGTDKTADLIFGAAAVAESVEPPAAGVKTDF
jgi:RNA polymerase sigma factor (sigma-70 family)